MMAQLQQELEEKEKTLTKLQAVVGESQEAKQPSIVNLEANTMTESSMVS